MGDSHYDMNMESKCGPPQIARPCDLYGAAVTARTFADVNGSSEIRSVSKKRPNRILRERGGIPKSNEEMKFAHIRWFSEFARGIPAM